jgi:hypothetical protein
MPTFDVSFDHVDNIQERHIFKFLLKDVSLSVKKIHPWPQKIVLLCRNGTCRDLFDERICLGSGGQTPGRQKVEGKNLLSQQKSCNSTQELRQGERERETRQESDNKRHQLSHVVASSFMRAGAEKSVFGIANSRIQNNDK